MPLDCLILAAGSASRFGSCKLLKHFDGKPLIQYILDATQDIDLASVSVVVGAYEIELTEFIDAYIHKTERKLHLSFNEGWANGIGHSISHGVNYLPPENAVLILLADQPLITANDLDAMSKLWAIQSDSIICSAFSNTVGVPAIFPPKYKSYLRLLRGDAGAKQVILENIKLSIRYSLPHAAFDIDSPADIELLHCLKNRM